jgi:hypothetical protein
MMSTNTSRGGRARTAPAAAGKKSGKKGRKPVAPVKVGKDRNWGPIALFVAVGVVAAGLIGWAAFAVMNQDTRPFHEQASDIEGLVNWYEEYPDLLDNAHQSGPVQYAIEPPAGGPHNELWQNCEGTIYDAPIATEHALHSLEHGAVWITYHPDLDASEVSRLASRVRGTDYTMLSPYPGQTAPISVQAWGFQLQVDSARDSRIDEFIRVTRHHAGLHAGPCADGITTTGTIPIG